MLSLHRSYKASKKSHVKSLSKDWIAAQSHYLPSRGTLQIALCLVLVWLLVSAQALSLDLSFAHGALNKTRARAVVLQAPRRQNELLVRFRGVQGEQQKDLVASAHGLRRQKTLRGQSGIEKLQLVSGRDLETAALELMLDPSVDFAEPNFLVSQDQLATTPNDPRFNEQWSLRNIGQSGGQYGADIQATEAWQRTTGSTNVVVAIVDSGIDFTHPDLVSNEWANSYPTNGDLHGWDFVTDSGVIKDVQGHGTAVAGIVAATGNNAIGTSGVMWRASLMSLRVLDETGTGDVAAAIEGIDYAVSHGAQVINLSWGTSGQSFALKDVIQRAIRSQVTVVCSAGNSGQDVDSSPYYPASFGLNGQISVAASDNFDQLTSWSNWGRRNVTIAAPGTSILTTQMGGGYWNVTGTSAAAPIVSGVAGLLRAFSPYANPHLIAKAISDGARQTVSLSGKITSGGIVSASGAFEKLHAPQSPALPIPGRGSGGTGPGGSFDGTAAPITHGTPGPNLRNLDQTRNTSPASPGAKAPIESNLMCADCDPQGGGGGASYYPTGDPNFSTARMRPMNETGEPGEDLGSQNFNWSVPILSLPGRSGLDLNLTLYYNSLVWTKDGSFIKFNADLGSPAPGFKLGLPTLQQKFTDSETNSYAFIMVLPSGGRVEMRRVGTSNIYESQDSSYTQLTDNATSGAVVRTTNGTQLSFTAVSINNEYRCTEIKDRNGNYISATYDPTNGHLLTVTDTLGRVVTFNYDGNSNLASITQTWAGVTHTWATFFYNAVYVSPGFGGGLLVNGPNGNNVTVLTQVNLDDGSYFVFDYNAAFGQINQIKRYALSGDLLNYIYYNLNTAAGQTECPRLSARRDWARYWNGDTDGVPVSGEEAVTSFSVDPNGAWTKVTLPDLTIYKEFFATSGWQKGLTTETKNYVSASAENSDSWKKRTTIAWTQDDTNLTYQKNPRPYDTRIYDEAGNQRRVETIYTSLYTSYNLPGPVVLPTEVKEYATDGTTVQRRTTTTYYDGGQEYIDRRVLGLLREVIVYDGNSQPQSKVWYDYDWSNEYWEATPQPATHHDASGTARGRGNLCWIGRWDVTDINNFDKHTSTFTRYNRTGSVIKAGDHWDVGSVVSYGDSFSDAVNRNTFAYPTTVTDADGFASTAQYNFDIGAVTKTLVPSKGTGLTGDPVQYLEHRMTYDSAGRLDRVTNQNNSAYTRYVYLSWGAVQSFTQDQTVVERYNITEFDGAGRVRALGMNHSGSTGGYSVQYFKYNNMGRLSDQSNPTEVNSSWVPAGDDSAWVWTSQTYDWKGRPLLTTNPDNSTRENSYAGCSCAGGETVTIRDERGRRRKLTMDVFGRLKQVDELNWDQSVYATTTYSYNALDELTQSSQAGQVRTFEYDGFGRLWKRTTPEQGLTTFTYNANDTLYQLKDARNVTQTFSYNNRRLVSDITYNVSGDTSGQTATTPNVSFGYNAAGNRTQMTDGLGSVSYGYNTLAQLTSETRSFTGVGSFMLSYTYDLGGQLLTLTNSVNNSQITYGYDHSTRVSGVTGSGYGGVSTYASNISYRAWSGLKSMSYGDTRALSIIYDNRLRPTQWNIPGVLGWNYFYDYFNEKTGRITYAQNINDPTLDRSYDYDNVGRLIEARTGSEARGHLVGQGGTQDGPYAHSYRYDQMGNMWYRVGWGGWFTPWLEQWPSYANNRLTTNPWTQATMTYDAAGNLINDGYQSYTYDATGQQTYASGTGLAQSYDGDRLRVKKVESSATTYYLRSTVLGGQVISELNSNGSLQRGYVYLGNQLLALQQSNQVSWVHQDPVTKSQRITNSSGTVTSTIDLDPWGGETSRSNNQAFQPHRYTSYERDGNGGDEAMMRRYTGKWHRFVQPDPYDGSYDLTDPQSFNRYTYVQNDPANFSDPTGLIMCLTCPEDPSWVEPPGWWIWWDASTGGPRGFGSPIIRGGDPAAAEPHGGRNGELHSWDQVQLVSCGEDSTGPLASLSRVATFTFQPSAQQRLGSPPIRPFFAPDFARRLSDAIIDMNNIGIVPQINDAFRTAADQQWYQSHGAGGNRPVNMGTSDHQTGYAVDINGVTRTMSAILQQHGLSPVSGDPPHFKITVDNKSTVAARAEDYYRKNCANLVSDPLPPIK